MRSESNNRNGILFAACVARCRVCLAAVVTALSAGSVLGFIVNVTLLSLCVSMVIQH